MKSSYDLNIASLIEMHMESRLLRWQSETYSMRVAFGEFYISMDELIDKFVTNSQNKYGGVELNRPIKLKNLSEFGSIYELIKQYITQFETFLITELVNTLDADVDFELFNLRDEMLFEVNKLKSVLMINKM